MVMISSFLRQNVCIMEFDFLLNIYAVFCYCQSLWLCDSYIPTVLLYSGSCGTARLVYLHLSTLTRNLAYCNPILWSVNCTVVIAHVYSLSWLSALFFTYNLALKFTCQLIGNQKFKVSISQIVKEFSRNYKFITVFRSLTSVTVHNFH